jgi:hypothetical protein
VAAGHGVLASRVGWAGAVARDKLKIGLAVGKIQNVEEPTPGHFYWPELDIDLSEEIIAHSERFLLKYK